MTAQENVTVGRVMDISKLEDLPKQLINSLLEGLSASPQDFVILGMGFLVGYEGMDILAFLMKPLNDLAKSMGSIFKGATDFVPSVAADLLYPIAALPTQMGGLVQDISRVTGGPVWFPNKHITAASKNPSSLGPGVSYYGPPPAGVDPADWPPYGTTLQKLQDEIANASSSDALKLRLEAIAAEQKLKILMGCMGAITAYTLSRPGVVSALAEATGNVVSGALQGLGSAVPL